MTEPNNEIQSSSSNSDGASQSQQKKLIFKKWWFWLVIVLVIVGIIGSLMPKEEPTDEAPTNMTTTTDLQSSKNQNADNNSNDVKPTDATEEQALQNDSNSSNTVTLPYTENDIREAVDYFVRGEYGLGNTDYEFQSIELRKISNTTNSVGGEAYYVASSGLDIYFIFVYHWDSKEAIAYEVNYDDGVIAAVDRENNFYKNSMGEYDDIK
jgi:cytoskeletal protein RodZ